jgi:hypothetical protein
VSTVTGIRLSLIASPVLAAQERLRRRVPRAGRTADAPRIIRVVVVRWWPVRNGAAAGPACIVEADIACGGHAMSAIELTQKEDRDLFVAR